jgi:uncharacterized integral membrane protein (TIGR00698 family)
MNKAIIKKNLLTLDNLKKIIFILLGLTCLVFTIDTPLALLLGILFSFIIGNPYPDYSKKITRYLLQVSVVGLGLGMNLGTAIQVGKEGLLFTAGSIFITLLIGIWVGNLFKIDKKISLLISSGTAICGGSAIAAVAPLIHADEEETGLSLSTIFILNSIALFIFPVIGHHVHLSQEQFGYWSALAIHDTSSVVGAAQHYGSKALEIATTVKLERALWIIPLSILIVLTFKEENKGKLNKKIKIPYFIFTFIAVMIFNTYAPKYITIFSKIDHGLVMAAKRGLTVTLFLIGAGLSFNSIKKIGIKPLLLGMILWTSVSFVSLLLLMFFFH